MKLASTLTCHGDKPITVVELGVGRLEPPITLQPGQYLIILDATQAVAMEGDCAVGQRSAVIDGVVAALEHRVSARDILDGPRHIGVRNPAGSGWIPFCGAEGLIANSPEESACPDCKAMMA